MVPPQLQRRGRPRLHRAFGIEPEDGFSSFLLGTRALADIVRETPVANLSLLPCGVIPPNPVELLGSGMTAERLAELLRTFDLVVFDSPPAGIVSDACVLGALADRVVFVVRSFRTDRGLARRAAIGLRRTGCRLIGAILNHTDAKAERYGGYEYRYGYESRYALADGEE